jgi:hypothetical protein
MFATELTDREAELFPKACAACQRERAPESGLFRAVRTLEGDTVRAWTCAECAGKLGFRLAAEGA